MPTVMLKYAQRGALVTKAEIHEILAESGVTVSDGWFHPGEMAGRGAGPVLTDPAQIIMGLRAADLGLHAAQGAAFAVGTLSVGWLRDFVKRIREHRDPMLAGGRVELLLSVGKYQSISIWLPREAGPEAARALNGIRLPPWPQPPFHWNVR